MSIYHYRQTLPDGALDIVGDVHGEWQALQALLAHLGYSPNGQHPQGRRLVMVGDLCDRGPDSPRVLSWFKAAHDAGHAYMVLGNHELNILMEEPKDGSGWFFPQRHDKDARQYAPWQVLPDSEKAELVAWLATQPLVLERPDLRIVHAAWLTQPLAQLAQIQTVQPQNLATWYAQYDAELNQYLSQGDLYNAYQAEQQQYGQTLEDNSILPPARLPATAYYEWQRSLRHPIRALTSGVEEIAPSPFFAGGRWRYTCRSPWWHTYQDDIPVIIGHYWRHWQSRLHTQEHAQFMPLESNAWFGARHNVFCIDYSVGARWRDRQQGIMPSQSTYRLAALRWPEKTLMFDNGETAETIRFGDVIKPS